MSEPDSGSLTVPERPAEGASRAAPAKAGAAACSGWVIEAVGHCGGGFCSCAPRPAVHHFKPFASPSPSMENTLLEATVCSSTASSTTSILRPWRVMCFTRRASGSDPFIKRVVAVGGAPSQWHDGDAYLNGVAQDESNVKGYPIEGDYPGPRSPADSVGDGGDNRTTAADSRVFGPVPLSPSWVAFAVLGQWAACRNSDPGSDGPVGVTKGSAGVRSLPLRPAPSRGGLRKTCPWISRS